MIAKHSSGYDIQWSVAPEHKSMDHGCTADVADAAGVADTYDRKHTAMCGVPGMVEDTSSNSNICCATPV